MRCGVLLGLGMAVAALSASPALADREGWRAWHGSRHYHTHHHFHHRGSGWHWRRGHHRGPPVVYAPPPVVYAPPPRVVYAPPPRVIHAPPPVIYAPPPVVVVPGYGSGYPVYRAPYGELSIGLNIPLGR